MSSKKKILILVIFVLIIIAIVLVFSNNNKEITFISNDKNTTVDQIYIYDDLKVYNNFNSKKVIGSVESDTWFNIIDSKIDGNDIWYKIKSKNRTGFIKGVDNFIKHIDEYTAIEKDGTILNVFYNTYDDISEIEKKFSKYDIKIKKYNIYFKESYRLFYMLSKEKKVSLTPCITINNMIYENYVDLYDELIKQEIQNEEQNNVLNDISYEQDKKTCIKDRKVYLNEDEYKKTKKEYENEISEIKINIEKSEKLIEQTGGFLSDEMFKKIADMTEDESSLETLKQRYILIDTYKRYKELLKNKQDALDVLNNYQDGLEEVSLYVFKCE